MFKERKTLKIGSSPKINLALSVLFFFFNLTSKNKNTTNHEYMQTILIY